MSYILNMLIYVGMILLNNLLQYFLFVVVINLRRNCESTIVLICNSLIMFASSFTVRICAREEDLTVNMRGCFLKN
jgi:hypothetical protein